MSDDAMTITALDHVQLAMPPGGEAAARAFYGDILGLAEVPKPAELGGRGGCWFERGAVKVHLGVEHDFRAAKKAHPAFVVARLEDLRATLQANGHITRDDVPVDGHPRCFVDDPFGNRIELIDQGAP